MSQASPQAVGDVPHAAVHSLRHPEGVGCLEDPGLGPVRYQEGVVVAEVWHNVRALAALAMESQEVRDDMESLPGAPAALQAESEQVHPQESADEVMVWVTQDVPNSLISNHNAFLENSLVVLIIFLFTFY